MKCKMKNKLDEMQEMKLRGIERNGCWFAFWALLAAMMIQLALTNTGALLGSGSLLYFLSPVVMLILFQLGSYLFATGLETAMNPRLRN